jgi:DNA-binding IclR family transcriptional regulator
VERADSPGEGTTLSALATGIKMGLFKHLAKDGGTPKKASDMAAAIDVHADTLTRLLRHITAMGYLIQTGPNEYKPTKFALSLTIPEVCDGYPEK